MRYIIEVAFTTPKTLSQGELQEIINLVNKDMTRDVLSPGEYLSSITIKEAS